MSQLVFQTSLFDPTDIYLFKQGKHYTLYNKFGAHIMNFQNQSGTYFAVWAPNAKNVSVVGDFNEWIPNKHGGRENLEAIDFIRNLNTAIYKQFPDIQMMAEESSAWPQVTGPVSEGGLGFGLKWNMGWMHDTLKYMEKDPLYRKFHHSELIFSRLYFHAEN